MSTGRPHAQRRGGQGEGRTASCWRRLPCRCSRHTQKLRDCCLKGRCSDNGKMRLGGQHRLCRCPCGACVCCCSSPCCFCLPPSCCPLPPLNSTSPPRARPTPPCTPPSQSW